MPILVSYKKQRAVLKMETLQLSNALDIFHTEIMKKLRKFTTGPQNFLLENVPLYTSCWSLSDLCNDLQDSNKARGKNYNGKFWGYTDVEDFKSTIFCHYKRYNVDGRPKRNISILLSYENGIV